MIKQKLAALINVKTIVTLAIVFVFVYLSVRGDIDPATAMTIISTVVAFYFGTQHEKKGGGNGG